MMTLNDAIKHAEDMAELNEAECFECAEEHRQLAKWLKELKELREKKRPHGEWILDSVAPCSISWFRCSYCGYKYEAYKQSNFCPNCGASMSANDRQVTGKLNSEIEKSKSEIVPDYRDGWRLKEGDEK